MLKTIRIAVTTTGGAGVATGTGVSEGVVQGYIKGLLYDFHASAPATTDVTVRTTATPTYNIHATTNTVTDVFVQPAGKPVDNANAAITSAHEPIPVNDYVTVTVAQSDALTNAVVLYVLVDDVR